MLREVLTAAAEQARVREGHAGEVGVRGLVVGALPRQGQHVGEGQSLVLAPRAPFVVGPPLPRLVHVVGHPEVRGIGIQGGARRVGHGPVRVALHVEVVEVATQRRGDEVQRVQFQAHVEADIVHAARRLLPALARDVVARLRIVHPAVVVALGLALRHPSVAIVQARGQPSRLRHQVSTGVRVEQGIDVGRQAPRHPLHVPAVHEHDVQYRLRAFGVFLGPRRRNDLDATHHRCRHGAQDFARVLRERGIEAPVLVNLKGRGTLHQDILLAVDSHERHLAKHIEDAVRTAVLIGRDVVAYAVDVLRHQLPLCRDGYGRQFGLQLDAVAPFLLQGIGLLLLCLCPCPQRGQGHQGCN